MPCVKMGNAILCGVGNPMYEWDGWLWEMHSYCGPTPLRKSDRSTPLVTVSAAFWRMWERWEDVPNKEEYRVYR